MDVAVLGVLRSHQRHFCAIWVPKVGQEQWVLRSGVADSSLSVLLHAQLFYISSIYISARHGTDI